MTKAMPIKRRALACLACLLPLTAGPSTTAQASPAPTFGNELVYKDPSTGISAFAGRVVVKGKVPGNVRAFAGLVEIDATIDGSLRSAAGKIEVRANVAGDGSFAGGKVDIENGSRFGGDLEIATGNATVDANVDGDLDVATGPLVFTGHVKGDATIAGATVEFGENTRIDGDLIVRASTEPEIPASMVIGGTYQFSLQDPDEGGRWSVRWDVGDTGFNVPVGLAGALWLFLGGIGAMVLAPGFTRRARRRMAQRPAKSGLNGFLLLIGVPILALILIISVIGIPFGVTVLLAFPLLLLMGAVFGAIGLSGLVQRTFLSRGPSPDGATLTPGRGQQILVLLGTVIVLALLFLVPVIGDIVLLVLLLIGTGAFGATIYNGEYDIAQEAKAAGTGGPAS